MENRFEILQMAQKTDELTQKKVHVATREEQLHSARTHTTRLMQNETDIKTRLERNKTIIEHGVSQTKTLKHQIEKGETLFIPRS